MSKYGEIGQLNFSLKVSKNYFGQVYGLNFGKNVINGVNFVKISHFWLKWSKFAHFGSQNDVRVQNLGKVVKIFYL